jgi:hypothetical protein
LISVSLAPVSYFFCALAAVEVNAAAAAIAVNATRLRIRAVIVLSPHDHLFCNSVASRDGTGKHPLIP